MRRHRTTVARGVALLLAAAVAAPLTLAGAAGTSATAAERTGDLVTNGGFEDWAAALPAGWSRWEAAGTGSVTPVAGRTGRNAARIATGTTTSRLALVRDVPLPTDARTFQLSFASRIAEITGSGRAGVRLNVLGADNESWFFGRTTPTTGWETTTETFTVPASATGIRVHVFNDGVRATMDVDDVAITAVEGAALRTEITPAGDIGLRWTPEAGAEPAATFEVHRAVAGTVLEPSAGTLLRTVPGSVTGLADVEWVAGTEYVYVVVGRDAAGHEVLRTNEATRRAPATDPTTTSYVSLTRAGDGSRVAWRVAADAALPLTVVHGDRAYRVGQTLRRTAGTTTGDRFGGVTVEGAPRTAALVDAEGTVLATADAAGLEHPRIGLDASTVEKIQELIAEPGTPQDAWETIVARVEGGRAAAGTTPERWAREAAFLYAVTGEQRYADLAWEGFAAAAAALPFGTRQELDTANPVSQMALVYDWAYHGWSPRQRAEAVEVFERTAAFFELVRHPNLVLPDKASNWVAVVRGAELAQHLAVRGDAGYGLREARIGQLIDQLAKHNEAAFTEHGWYQEGLEYLDYEAMIATSGTLASFDAGIHALRASWYGPDVVDLLLRTVSFREPEARLQWGVAAATGVTAFPLYLERAKGDGRLGGLIELFERTAGHRAQTAWYSPGYITQALIDWPAELDAEDAYDPAAVLPALLDDEAGSYSFRNRLVDSDDVLLQLNNRNHTHLGWNGHDTFAVSLMSHGATWASQPAKNQGDAARYSRVLVDGRAAQVPGHGVTHASRGYAGQGGGYVSLEAPGAFGVSTAAREAVVDMTDRGAVDTVVAFRDRFADDAPHTWTWQLAPEAGTAVDVVELDGDVLQLTFRRGDGWLRGWVLDAGDATAELSNGSFRVVRTGTEAAFDVVLAVGDGPELPELATDGSRATVGGATVDLARLAEHVPTAP